MLLMVVLAGADPPLHYAIRGARIVPVSAPVIDNGTVVMRDGLITAVGTNVPIPAAALIIEGKGLTVYPGLIDALSTIGLPEGSTSPGQRQESPAPLASRAMGPEDRPQTTPWVHAADLINSSDRRIEAARNAGFTTAHVAPQRGIFPGFGAIVNLGGQRVGQMIVKTPAALYVTFSSSGFGGGFPGSLMGTVAYVRQTFLDARHYQQAWAVYNNDGANHLGRAGARGRKRPQYDRALEHLQNVISGRAPVLLPAVTDVQLRRYVDFGQELGAPFVLYGAHEAYEVAELLAERKVSVLVNSKWPEPERDRDPDFEDSLRALRLRERAPTAPAALHKAGVRFAFYSDNPPSPRDAIRNVKRAIDAGLPAEAAARAMTLTAAEILGVADVLGSIEPGKIANLVVTDGDLFADRTRVKYVFVDGRKFTVPEEEAQPAAAPSVNITGAWSLAIETATPMIVTATLQQEGSAITGSLSGDAGQVTISDGSITGANLRFRATITLRGRQVDATFRGTISGDNIKGTVSGQDLPSANFSGSRPQ